MGDVTLLYRRLVLLKLGSFVLFVCVFFALFSE